MARIVIDPITRIGGHLRLELEASGGVVKDAWSCGTAFRGVERIIEGRDPRDAWLFAQRICGICNGAHALASVRAVESALGVAIPKNARLLRNVVAGAQFVIDHVVHFYHLGALDWVDVKSAVAADPAQTAALARSTSAWTPASAAYFKGTRDRFAALLESGQGGSLGSGPWGHPAYRMPPEANLLVLAHYLEALDWQRRFSRVHAILGGKNPHPQTFLVGGMALAPAWAGPQQATAGEHPQLPERNSPWPLGANGIAAIADLVAGAQTFVQQVYLPDALTVAGYYRDWTGIGAGIGNYLSYGEFPEADGSQPGLLLPSGRILGRAMTKVEPVDQADVAEAVAHSHFAYEGEVGAGGMLPPSIGQTTPRYGGPPPPVATFEGVDAYSWIKAPRYQQEPMEVGPLARMLVGYVEGRSEIRAGLDAAVSRLGLGADALFGTLGRIIARAVEAQVIVGRLDGWVKELADNMAAGDLAVADLARWEPDSWPAEASGWSLGESPRGALGHWVAIRDRKVSRYQVVDASTWNGSPRDGSGRRGAWEEALVGTPLMDAAQPVEVLRVLHSFDPCAACAAHVHDPAGMPAVDLPARGGDR